jgi:hypothetical protein
MTIIFTSTQQAQGEPGYPERSGQTVEVLRPLTMGDAESEVDWESGPMFQIRFADGVEAVAWDDELDPTPVHPQLAEYEAIMAAING